MASSGKQSWRYGTPVGRSGVLSAAKEMTLTEDVVGAVGIAILGYFLAMIVATL